MMTHEDLAAALAAVEPVRLLGLALLEAHRPRPGEWFPPGVATGTLVDATAEFIDYAHDCQAVCRRLEPLPPIPLAAQPIPEFPL
jgi:hypothetical protein